MKLKVTQETYNDEQKLRTSVVTVAPPSFAQESKVGGCCMPSCAQESKVGAACPAASHRMLTCAQPGAALPHLGQAGGPPEVGPWLRRGQHAMTSVA